MIIKIAFLGTPPFVQPIKETLSKHFTLVDSLNKADLGIVAAYGKILTTDELNTPRYGAINIHPSLLPQYRGPSPIQEALLNGDKVSGISIIKMDEEVDHGPIIYQEKMELINSDNFDILSKKMFQRANEVLPQVINDFLQKKITPRLQDHARATYCNRLTKESGYFDINNPPSAEKLDRMIRAYYPWPGAWTRWNPSPSSGQAKIVKFIPNVTLSPSPVTLSETKGICSSPSAQNNKGWDQNDKFLIQMEGKKVVSLKDFLNGYSNFPLKSITLDNK